MKELKRKIGFRSYNALLTFLIETVNREGVMPPASKQSIFKDSKPVVLTGNPGSGKTTFAKSLMQEVTCPIFVLDVADEYNDLKRVDLGKFFNINWSKADGKYRFVPHPNVTISKAEANTIFSHLNLIKQNGSLKEWLIVIEEGHRFSDDTNFRSLIIEARKFIKKLLVISTDWKAFEGMAETVKPPAWIPVESVNNTNSTHTYM
jgi:Cdc6-like AAA superfamily ATPase